jgi:hypothetical protein
LSEGKGQWTKETQDHNSGSAPLVVNCLGQNVYPTMNALQVAIRTEYRRWDDQDGDDNSEPSKWNWCDRREKQQDQ